eukprot:3733439-Rhodomonas_salina.1
MYAQVSTRISFRGAPFRTITYAHVSTWMYAQRPLSDHCTCKLVPGCTHRLVPGSACLVPLYAQYQNWRSALPESVPTLAHNKTRCRGINSFSAPPATRCTRH